MNNEYTHNDDVAQVASGKTLLEQFEILNNATKTFSDAFCKALEPVTSAICKALIPLASAIRRIIGGW